MHLKSIPSADESARDLYPTSPVFVFARPRNEFRADFIVISLPNNNPKIRNEGDRETMARPREEIGSELLFTSHWLEFRDS